MPFHLLCSPSTAARQHNKKNQLNIVTYHLDGSAKQQQVFEVNYDDEDDGPTSLYQAIESKAWAPILQFLETGTWESGWFLTPELDPQSPYIQAQTWVTRFENTGEGDSYDESSYGAHSQPSRAASRIRWSQLPLHAAILFGAPLTVLKALLDIYPPAIRCTDDEHSLPLHLAMRMGASDTIINYLAGQFPPALQTRNQLGHLPCQVAVPIHTQARRDLMQLCMMTAPSSDDTNNNDSLIADLQSQLEQVQLRNAELEGLLVQSRLEEEESQGKLEQPYNEYREHRQSLPESRQDQSQGHAARGQLSNARSLTRMTKNQGRSQRKSRDNIATTTASTTRRINNLCGGSRSKPSLLDAVTKSKKRNKRKEEHPRHDSQIRQDKYNPYKYGGGDDGQVLVLESFSSTMEDQQEKIRRDIEQNNAALERIRRHDEDYRAHRHRQNATVRRTQLV